MFLSKLFIPITKDLPAEAKIKSHQLMLRTGMIKQSSAGIYSWLPLGFKVMKKIEQIIREEQNAIGAQEMLMPTIQSSEIWKESGRYEDYGEEMLRIKDRQGREMLYGPTNIVAGAVKKSKGQKVLNLPEGRTKSVHDAPTLLLGGHTRHKKC